MEGLYCVKNDTYGFSTYLVICDREDFPTLSRKAPLKLNAADANRLLESVEPSTAGFTITLSCSNLTDAYLIWLPMYDNTIDDVVTLAHEVSHAAFFALKHRGWEGFEDIDKQHSQMYLKDSIFRSFLMQLDAESKKSTKKKKKK